MSERSVTHATFTIERRYDATPARVFAAWARPEIKTRWFRGPDEWSSRHEMDFRAGGRERASGGPRDGVQHVFDAYYHEIVPERRIIYSYDMHLDARRISVSLATAEFKPDGKGTRLIFTEQAAFLDGYDDAGSREAGSRQLLEKLGEALRD